MNKNILKKLLFSEKSLKVDKKSKKYTPFVSKIKKKIETLFKT